MRHASAAQRIWVRRSASPGRSLATESPGGPALDGATRPAGWGLVLVDRIADRWGVSARRARHGVWFEIAARNERHPPFWREALAPYARPHLGRSLLDIATSVVPYLVLLVLMYLALDVSYLLVLALALPRRRLPAPHIHRVPRLRPRLVPAVEARQRLARERLGLIVYAPFQNWRHSHAVHHATAGDLDRRGVGDVHTLTVAEYQAARGGSGSAIGCSATRW